MTRRNHEERLRDGRYRRWVELEPVQAKVWRYAWDLLLEDKPERTLEDICIALHERGYKLRSGASFVNFMPNGKIRYHKSALTRSFHNPFYAGLIYLHEIFEDCEFEIIHGDWTPIITPEEFARGVEILAQRDRRRNHKSKRFYLLKSMIFLRQADGSIIKLKCSTPNANRTVSGVSYYCLPSSSTNFPCSDVNQQIASFLHNISVDEELLPAIREAYMSDLDNAFGGKSSTRKEQLQHALVEIRQEEVRAGRLVATGKMADDVYNELWRE